MKSETLKPCPFCGEVPIVEYDLNIKLYSVSCHSKKCHICLMTWARRKKQDAIDYWNQRAGEPQWKSEPPKEPGLYFGKSENEIIFFHFVKIEEDLITSDHTMEGFGKICINNVIRFGFNQWIKIELPKLID
jgi:Lar family restriction alleviation protein